MISDVRLAFRQLMKSPGFTLVALLTLALGLGANTAIFSIIHSVLLRPLPFPEPDRLVQVWERNPVNGHDIFASGLAFKHWRDHNTTLEGLSYFLPASLTLTGAHTPDRLRGLQVSASFLSVLGIRPMLGEDFAADADQVGGQSNVVQLTHEFWHDRFGGDPGVVGRTLILDQVPHTVVGILPPRALPRSDVSFLVPVSLDVPGEAWRMNPMTTWATVTARLKPGISVADAAAELNAIKRAQVADYPVQKHDWTVSVVGLREQMTAGSRPALLMLLAAGALVLLIACANVANLLLARSTGRQKEMAVRSALGATPSRIVRQVLTENILLALMGAAIALVVALATVDVLGRVTEAVEPARTGIQRAIHSRLTGGVLPGMFTPKVDWVVLAFTVLTAVATGALAALAPALRASRADPNLDLKTASSASTSRSRSLGQSLLVSSEVALTVLLLITAGLFLRSFANTIAASPGFEAERAVSFELASTDLKYPTPDAVTRFSAEVVDRLAELPGIEAAGVATTLPFSQETWGGPIGLADDPNQRLRFGGGRDYVTGDYFAAMGIPLLSGRYLNDDDNQPDAPKVAVINDALARTMLPNENPIGRRVVFDGNTYEIVGVVGSVRVHSLDGETRPCVYATHRLNPGGTHVVMKTSLPLRDLQEVVARTVHAIDPDQAITLRPFSVAIQQSLGGQRVMLGLIAGFATLAVALACLGIYGVVAYTVGQRRRELGIRLALGALPHRLVGLVLRDGMRLAVVGLAVGLAAAIGGARFMSSMLYGVSASDPLVFITVALLLATIATIACWIPARRVTHVDPLTALRAE